MFSFPEPKAEVKILIKFFFIVYCQCICLAQLSHVFIFSRIFMPEFEIYLSSGLEVVFTFYDNQNKIAK